MSTTLRRLTNRIHYSECFCVLRRYCPYQNTLNKIPANHHEIYSQISAHCSCPCAYCQDSPNLRSCLFPHSEVVGIPSKLLKDLPNFDRLDLNSLCNVNRIHTEYQIFARNADTLYRQDPQRHQLVVQIPDSTVSSVPYIHKVFGSDDPWLDDSYELLSIESRVAIDFNATVQVDTRPIQLVIKQIQRCPCKFVPCQCTPLTAFELMSLQFQTTVDSQNLPCVSFSLLHLFSLTNRKYLVLF